MSDTELRISDVLDALPFYVLLIDEDHHILQANVAVRDQLGFEPEAIIGKYCPKIIHGLDAPWQSCPLEEAAEKGQPVERVARDEGSGRWIRSVVYPTQRRTVDGKRIFYHMVADVTEAKQADDALNASHEQIRNLSVHLESVCEETKTKVAREVHDELGQILTAAMIDLSWVAKRLPAEQESLFSKVASTREMLDKAVETVKRISTELRPGVLDDLGLAAAIEWQGHEFEKHTEIRFEFEVPEKDIVLDRDRSTALFRIFQEALTNVARHAEATTVRVCLKEEDDKISVSITDNGKGIDMKQLSNARAFGLIGMRERALNVGGVVDITGSPGSGTTVLVTIPVIKVDALDSENTHR